MIDSPGSGRLGFILHGEPPEEDTHQCEAPLTPDLHRQADPERAHMSHDGPRGASLRM